MQKSSGSRMNFFRVRVSSVCLLVLALGIGIEISGLAKSRPGRTTATSRNALANSFSAAPAKSDFLPEGRRSNAPLFTCTWTGSVDNAWSTAGNWSGCNGTTPQSGDTVTIGAAARNPVLDTTAPVAGFLSTVTINSGGLLDIITGGVLNTNADFSLNGGILRMNFDATVNVGPGAETNFIYTTGAVLQLLAGSTTASLNIGGRLSPSVASDTISYTQRGGTVTVAIAASNDPTFGAFSIPAAGSSFTMSGGTIILDQASSAARDCRILATTSSVTGGTLQFGDATGTNTAAGSSFGVDSTPVLFNLTVAHPNVDHLNVGSDVTVSNVLTLSGGNVISIQGATLIIGSSGSINRTNGSFVICALQKNSLSSAFTFHVGSTSDNGVTPIGYTPISLANVSGGGNLKVKTTASVQPSVNATHSLKEYWTLTKTGSLTTDLTFNYLQGDVQGTEGNYRIIRVSGGTAVSFPATVLDTINNTATLAGVSSFSDWTLGETVAPTVASASISGKIAASNGQPIGGVTVSLSGNKSDRTITDANGQYHFDNVQTEGFYAVTPGLVNYAFSPASRSFALLADKTDAVFTATTLTESNNPINGADYFVRQQYLDFLGREPEHAGWLFWTDQINRCGLDEACVLQRRLDVSAAFFMSDEFQQSGNYIYRLYRAALGRQLSYSEFSADHRLVVGGPDLESSKTAFAETFVQRPEFLRRYQNTFSAETFVDSLLQNVLQDSGLDLSDLRDSLIQRYNSGGNLNQSRSAVIRELADSGEYQAAVYNGSFVLMEYFGYLHRDADRTGYDFWLNVLNGRESGNYRGMVCAFTTSTEYQRRFGSVVTRSNRDCSQ